MAVDLHTRQSLLLRLRAKNDDCDWQMLYAQYRGVILSFCRRQGLDQFSAEDVLQETMVLLMRKLPDFCYTPERGKFRNWLLKLVAGKLNDAKKRARRAQLISLEEQFEEVLDAESPDASTAVEAAWRQALVDEALRRIKEDPRTKRQTFEIFESYVLKGHAVSVVAEAFGVEENSVYQIKNRTLRRLEAEIKGLEAAVAVKHP